jgi:hypothetical protein
MKTPYPFSYPDKPHVRRHGPSGFADYESYRQWLRDEFCFRCVYCLRREQWGIAKGNYDIDHLLPQSIYPAAKLDYDNLIYLCHTCNITKSNKFAPDPSVVAFGKSVRVNDDGTIIALNKDGKRLIKIMGLDDKEHTQARHIIIRTVQILAVNDRNTYILWMRYPENLPDLNRLRPPSNTRPKGVEKSYFAMRARGELDEVY